MSVTVPQLAARALRKLGVAIVADSAVPDDTATVTAADIAARALREVGIVVPPGARPAAAGSVPQAELAARALRAVGVNPAGPALSDGTSAGIVALNAIATEALIRLGVIDPVETANASDMAEAVAAVGGVVNGLIRLGIADWGVDTIPASATEPLIVLTMQFAASAFGRSGSPEMIQAAQDTLRRQALSGAKGQARAADRIASVHEALNAAALVTWTVATVPAAYADDYVGMAAILLRAEVGLNQDAGSRQADEAAWKGAEDRVRRGAQIATASALAASRVSAVISELSAANLVGWSPDAIPQSVADALVALAAQSIGPSFGRPSDPQAMAAAARRVRMVAMGGAAGQALAEQKVRAVHADLDARGKTRWSLFDLPDYAEEPYTLMAAFLLAPEVDVKTPDWWTQGQQMINRLIVLSATDRPVPATYF